MTEKTTVTVVVTVGVEPAPLLSPQGGVFADNDFSMPLDELRRQWRLAQRAAVPEGSLNSQSVGGKVPA